MRYLYCLFLVLFVDLHCVLLGSSTDISFQFNRTIYVDATGMGDFLTVQEAVDSIPPGNLQWIRIYIKTGTYNEKVVIPVDKQFVYMEGEGKDRTVIVSSDCLYSVQLTEVKDLTETSALYSMADNFVAKHIGFKNAFPTSNGIIRRAVAASIEGDMSSFHFCGFSSLQDTLYDKRGRHFFRACYIEGAVDFIFGDGQSIYQKCIINVTIGLNSPYTGYITAQGRNDPQSHGAFVFVHSIVEGFGKAYLGRAWRQYARVIFYNSYFSDVVESQGWDSWGKNTSNIFYGELNCYGPGANTSERVQWERKLDIIEAKKFSNINFIDGDGWLARQPR